MLQFCVLIFLSYLQLSVSVSQCANTKKLPFTRIQGLSSQDLIETLYIGGWMQCARQCNLHSNCRSFNFNSNSGICHLYRQQTSGTGPFLTTARLYGEKNMFNHVVDGMCAETRCPDNYRCYEEDCITEIHRKTCMLNESCVTSVEVSKMIRECMEGTDGTMCVLEDCGKPPEFEYTNIIRMNGTTVGNTVMYNCSTHGRYRAEMTCQENGIWGGDFCELPASCADIFSYRLDEKGDGEYSLYPKLYDGRTKIQVYCHDMNSTNPTEYITVPRGNTVTFFDPDPLKQCQDQLYGLQDPTKDVFLHFSKIRLLIDSMLLQTHDFVFAKLQQGELQNDLVDKCFEERSICNYTESTEFNFNISGTGLKFPDFATGVMTFQRRMTRLSDYEVNGKCAGACTNCSVFVNQEQLLRVEATPSYNFY